MSIFDNACKASPYSKLGCSVCRTLFFSGIGPFRSAAFLALGRFARLIRGISFVCALFANQKEILANVHVHLVNPSDSSFGIGVITPRWLYVLAAATPARYGDPVITDETLAPFQPESIEPGDVVGIGIHTGNALRGMELGKIARERGAYVVYGGIHASLYPNEAMELGGAHAIVKGDGDVIWGKVIADLLAGTAQTVYDGGRISGDQFLPARWDLAPRDKYMWASVQTVRGCPKHCSFCSVWRTDGQKPRPRTSDVVVREIVDLRRRGFRFIALADDNFYPVSLADLRLAEQQGNTARVAELHGIRAERFELMRKLSELPKDMVFFTQITMEAGEDTEYLDAMRRGEYQRRTGWSRIGHCGRA